MKKIYLLFGLMFVMLLSGCSPFNLIESTVYNNAQLRDYTTFRIVTPDEDNVPPGMTMVTYYNIAAAIREQMLERGYREDPNSPMLINIGLTVKQEVTTEPALPPRPYFAGPFYHGYRPWFMYPRSLYWPRPMPNYPPPQVVTGIYHEGVLTMDIINVREKLPLFSASVGTIMQNGDTQFRNLEGIAKAVNVLFSNFPVPILPQYKNK